MISEPPSRPWPRPPDPPSSASGVTPAVPGVVVADGRVLTNAHNLRGSEVTVTFADGRSTVGAVAGVDADGDLAVIKVDTAGATALAWGDGDALAVGTPVFGAAATVGAGVRVTFGLVSAVSRAFRGPGGRRIAGSVEHTAPMAPGSSGSALLDGKGKLVGVEHEPDRRGVLSRAPRRCDAQSRVDALGRGEMPERARLGVAIAPNHVARRLRRSVGLAERDGVLVRGVEDESLAAAAGIEAGDLIVSAGGKPITDGDDLFDALGLAQAAVRARPRPRLGGAHRQRRGTQGTNARPRSRASPARRSRRRASVAGVRRVVEHALRLRERHAASRSASAASASARIAAASRPALVALPIATVATGMPRGIWTIDSSESRPPRCCVGIGTPMTGSAVLAASIPGRCAAPPAPAMITRMPRPARSSA